VGEYERFVATAINAYVGPRLAGYLKQLRSSLEHEGFGGNVLIMNCSGGVIGSTYAGATAVQTINSGPAAGVLGCERLASMRGEPDVVTTDMGGTTFDVAIITRSRPVRRSTSIAHQHEYYVETLDVQSVGAGGGSVAWVDEVTGALHVGPRSAGSDPGPACYARGGTEATVTDADVVLGVINPDNFLGGAQRLDVDRAQAAVMRVGDLLGLSMLETAAGICQIADAKMADLIRRMTVKRGLDPRGFVVYAYGGAGPLHVGAYGRELGAAAAVVPLGNLAPVWSAFGAAAANVTRTRFAPLILLEPFDTERMRAAVEQLASDVTAALLEEGFSKDAQRLECIAEVRYGAQIHTLNVDVPELVDGWEQELIERFERDYELTYGAGTGYRKAGVEVSGVKVTGVGQRTLPRFPTHDHDPASGSESTRDIYWYELRQSVSTPIRNHGALRPSETLSGPVVVELPTTSVVIRPGQSAHVDSLGNVIIRLDDAAPSVEAAAEDVTAGVTGSG
jgi:N-methylhydantoinase A